MALFSDTKRRKYEVKDLIRRCLSGDRAHRLECTSQIKGKQFQGAVRKTPGKLLQALFCGNKRVAVTGAGKRHKLTGIGGCRMKELFADSLLEQLDSIS